MVNPAQAVRSTISNAPESEAGPGRQHSAHQAPTPGLAKSPIQRLHSMISGRRKVHRMGEMVGAVGWLSDRRNKRELANWQQVTIGVLIKKFGPKVGLSMDLYKKVSEGDCSDEEVEEYLAKTKGLTEELHEFYRKFDVATLDQDVTKMEEGQRKEFNDNLDVLIAMLNTGFAVTQNQTTHISKVMNNRGLDTRLGNAIDKNIVNLSGYIGSSESTEALSPQQQISTLGLDYEYTDKKSKETRTDFLLQTGTDAQGKPTYEAIPQTSYMKIAYTSALKKATQMTLDVRFYEKILERAKRATGEDSTLTLGGEDAIAEMAKQICMKPVCLKYKIADAESDQEAASKSQEFTEKLKMRVSADRPPFTGLGFSAHGEKIGKGFLNMYPEMNIATQITKENFKKILGSNKPVKFYTKFAKSNTSLTTNNPDGSTDVLIGSWDGEEVSMPEDAHAEYDRHFQRVTEKFSDNEKNTASLKKNRLPVEELQQRLAKSRLKAVQDM